MTKVLFCGVVINKGAGYLWCYLMIAHYKNIMSIAIFKWIAIYDNNI